MKKPTSIEHSAAQFLSSHLDPSEIMDVRINEPIIDKTFLTLHPEYNSKYGKANRKIMKSLLDIYGKNSEQTEGRKTLNISADGCHGKDFYLFIDDYNGYIYLMHEGSKENLKNAVAYWSFKALEEAIKEAYPPTLFADIETRVINGEEKYRYTSFWSRKSLPFMTFLIMIMDGLVNYQIIVKETPGRFSSEQKWIFSTKKKDLEKIRSMFAVEKLA